MDARSMTTPAPRIAVLVPCYNESAAIADVVASFREALPTAAIYVYDNNSTDGTAAIAAQAGARVRYERRQGKGHVVRRMFADVEADIYVLVDGDCTYEAQAAPALIQCLTSNAHDMVTGVRIAQGDEAYRTGHRFGNRLLTGLITLLFRSDVRDMLSGYRVLSRRLVKSFPIASRGFEIETELTVHALELDMSVGEVETRYGARPENSQSKLNTIQDGFRILIMIWRLLQQERPALIYGGLGLLALLFATAFSMPVVLNYFQTGLVPRFPTLIMAGALSVSGLLSIAAGAIISAISHGRREIRRLFYLQQPVPVWSNDENN